MEALIGLIGVVIGFFGSYFIMKHQHKITVKQKKEDEIKFLQTQIRSYIQYLGVCQQAYALQDLNWDMTRQRSYLINKQKNSSSQYNNDYDQLRFAEKAFEAYGNLNDKTQKLVELISRIGQLKEIDVNKIVTNIWNAPFDIDKAIKEIKETKNISQLNKVKETAIETIVNIGLLYKTYINNEVKDLIS